MPPSIFRTHDFSNQFPFPLEVRKIGIPLYSRASAFWSFLSTTMVFTAFRTHFARKNTSIFMLIATCHEERISIKVPLRQKFVGLFRPNFVAEYRVVSIFTWKTEQETVHLNIF